MRKQQIWSSCGKYHSSNEPNLKQTRRVITCFVYTELHFKRKKVENQVRSYEFKSDQKNLCQVGYEILKVTKKRSSRPDLFCKKGVLRNFAKFT